MRKHWPLLAATMVGTLFGLFQNCGMQGFRVRGGDVMTFDLPSDHPPTPDQPVIAPASGSLVLGDRDFLESYLFDVFAAVPANSGYEGYLQEVMYQEFMGIQQLLGRPCDPLRMGTNRVCGYRTSNMLVAASPASYSMREAARIQVCRRILANDSVVSVLRSKIGTDTFTPSATTLPAAYALFFPAGELSESVKEAFVQLDEAMVDGNESEISRWRAIFLTLCEVPTWQVI